MCCEMLSSDVHYIFRISGDGYMTVWRGKFPTTCNLSFYEILQSLEDY